MQLFWYELDDPRNLIFQYWLLKLFDACIIHDHVTVE